MSDAHCESCGTRREAAVRCETCGALSGSAWILALGVALWVAVFAVYGVMAHWVWPDLLKVLNGLGAAPPVSARAYILVNRWFHLAALAVALLGPVVVLTLGRGRPGRFPDEVTSFKFVTANRICSVSHQLRLSSDVDNQRRCPGCWFVSVLTPD